MSMVDSVNWSVCLEDLAADKVNAFQYCAGLKQASKNPCLRDFAPSELYYPKWYRSKPPLRQHCNICAQNLFYRQ